MRYVYVRSAIAIAVVALCGAFQPAQAMMIDFNTAEWSGPAGTPVFTFLYRATRGTEWLSTFNNGSDMNPLCGFRSCQGDDDNDKGVTERASMFEAVRFSGVRGYPRSFEYRSRERSGRGYAWGHYKWIVHGTTPRSSSDTDGSSGSNGATSVPEPATLLLTAIGVAGTAAFRRRRVK